VIVYRSTKDGFTSDVDGGNIDAIILENFKAKLKHSTSHREVQPGFWAMTIFPATPGWRSNAKSP
jgi:hypothetical protein